MTTEIPETTSDERTMGTLAHFFGMFAALIIWATQKDKSRFVRFQALQAIAFDGLLMVFTLGLMFCFFSLMFVGIGATFWLAANAPSSEEATLPILLSTLLPMLIFACVMPVSLAAVIVRVIAAVSVASGRNFRYPLIAPRLEKFLANE